MEISIIIPAYNSERYLRETIDGVLAQTTADWELIVVDDGSTDCTAEIVESYARRDARIRLVRQKNSGPPSGHNRGFQETCPASEYIIFLDHDDVWDPDALTALRAALNANPQAVAAHGLARFIDDQGAAMECEVIYEMLHKRLTVDRNKTRPLPCSEPTGFASLIYQNCIATPGAILLRRSTLEKVGCFDPARYIADWDLWIRVARSGNIAFVNQEIISYRLHGTGMSANTEKLDRDTLAVRNIVLHSPDNSPEQNRIARQCFRILERLSLGHEYRMLRRTTKRLQARQATGHLLRMCRHALRCLEPLPMGSPSPNVGRRGCVHKRTPG